MTRPISISRATSSSADRAGVRGSSSKLGLVCSSSGSGGWLKNRASSSDSSSESDAFSGWDEDIAPHFTVKLAVPVTEPRTALIVTEPVDKPVATPREPAALLTLATLGVVESQVT